MLLQVVEWRQQRLCYSCWPTQFLLRLYQSVKQMDVLSLIHFYLLNFLRRKHKFRTLHRCRSLLSNVLSSDRLHLDASGVDLLAPDDSPEPRLLSTQTLKQSLIQLFLKFFLQIFQFCLEHLVRNLEALCTFQLLKVFVLGIFWSLSASIHMCENFLFGEQDAVLVGDLAAVLRVSGVRELPLHLLQLLEQVPEFHLLEHFFGVLDFLEVRFGRIGLL